MRVHVCGVWIRMDVARASGSRHPDAWPHRGAASSAPHRHPIHPWAPCRLLGTVRRPPDPRPWALPMAPRLTPAPGPSPCPPPDRRPWAPVPPARPPSLGAHGCHGSRIHTTSRGTFTVGAFIVVFIVVFSELELDEAFLSCLSWTPLLNDTKKCLTCRAADVPDGRSPPLPGYVAGPRAEYRKTRAADPSRGRARIPREGEGGHVESVFT